MRDLTTFWGLLGGYWRSDRWHEAWGFTVLVLLLTTLLSKASVWAAVASGTFIAALAGYHDAAIPGARSIALSTAILVFFAVHIGRAAGIALRHLLSATLHRRARAWLVDRFNAALLADNRVALDLMSDRQASHATESRLPDAIDQRVDVCTIGLYGGLIGLAMGLWGAVASIWFVSRALIERSAEVPLLDQWIASATAAAGAFLGSDALAALDLTPGRYGSAILAGLLIIVYVPALTAAAWLIGRVIQRLEMERQRRDGAWRGELNTMLNRVAQLAASHGEGAQKRINEALYTDVDRIWRVQNLWGSGLLMFTNVYNFLSRRLLAYLPALPGYTAGTLDFRDFVSSSELTAELIGDMSWFINVMPAIALLRANARRLNQLAAAIEDVGAREAFYGRTGISRFHRVRDPALRGLRLTDLALRHRGHGAEPFLRVPGFRLSAGEWSYVIGPSGCGKSALLKAIDGLWPYGEGTVAIGAHDRVMFAGQEPDIPERLTLKSLVTYPRAEEAFDDRVVSGCLASAGLGEFLPDLHSETRGGLSWRRVLSGGQRRRLILARILLQRPTVLLLDEATSGLEPAATLDYYRLLKRALPEAAVLSVHHVERMHVGEDGSPLFDFKLEISNGLARQSP